MTVECIRKAVEALLDMLAGGEQRNEAGKQRKGRRLMEKEGCLYFLYQCFSMKRRDNMQEKL